ncbi:hypothetical protein CTI12_AA344530 [Artemisia annua]|uniref:Uncharacterized protein n=1 Tax=Artemisia annua TaxID=35608 RepID=A0A2U1MSV3_ARTAN|nr:hypothetical protein CTI12_AA344530 [Artemisia annua]
MLMIKALSQRAMAIPPKEATLVDLGSVKLGKKVDEAHEINEKVVGPSTNDKVVESLGTGFTGTDQTDDQNGNQSQTFLARQLQDIEKLMLEGEAHTFG